ncbi:hypothetical protein DPMN_000014 [Dreissena polymorpha]|uniref:Uncharacterized protein n=1 Tax=Dreissena polymorpha TaxID=45954 RepID=A0A9D4RPK1_DREPO|nr:hypothetical protein DPMN_000014 [Dreissena polymorpha]
MFIFSKPNCVFFCYRLKQTSKKSGLSDEVFSATDQWVWDNLQFLVPHIVDVQRRNFVSFMSEIPTSNASLTSQQSTDAEGDSPAPSIKSPSSPKRSLSPSRDNTGTLGMCLNESFLVSIKT